MYPDSFPMRHYLFLSVPHAIEKYVNRVYDPDEVTAGVHSVRAALRPESIVLLSAADLRFDTGDGPLDATAPLAKHPVFGMLPEGRRLPDVTEAPGN